MIHNTPGFAAANLADLENVFILGLTGGPCAGKTSGKVKIRERAEALGYRVLHSREVATDLLETCQPPQSEFETYHFQMAIFKAQLAIEEALLHLAAMKYGAKTLILLDRTLLDSKAYVNGEMWNVVCRANGITMGQIYERYHAILHLTTAALGAEPFYNLDNPARYEKTLEAARLADEKTRSAWLGFPKAAVIDNSSNFEDKMLRAGNQVMHWLGEPEFREVERKFRVKNVDYKKIKSAPSSIIQTYLNGSNDFRSRRVRRRESEGSTQYIFTEKIRVDGQKFPVEQERYLSFIQYLQFMDQASQMHRSLHKVRHCFVDHSRYWELDLFTSGTKQGQHLLEVECRPDEVDIELQFPDGLEIVEEVTGQSEWSNEVMARM